MSHLLEEILVYAIVFGIPGLSVLFFAVSLIRFLSTDKADTQKRKKWKMLLIVSAVLAAILVGGLVLLIIMLSIAMAHM